jgi:abortive infection bacteriophage resistance protein
MQAYTKPFLTIEQQVALLSSRGLAVTDRPLTEKYLRNIGYYRLSGYWYPLRDSHRVTLQGIETREILDTYRIGAEFAHVVALYTYDNQLRLLMLDVLEQVEVALRTDIVLQLGQYGPWAYRESSLLDQKFVTHIPTGKTESQFTQFIKRFDDMVVKSKSDFVKHFKAKYSDPLPIWAAVELWDFGMLSVFFSGLKYKDQRAIATRYNLSRPELLPTWIRTLADIRNICAHHSRLWNRGLTSQPKIPRVGEIVLLDHLHTNSVAYERLYGAVAIAGYMQSIINPHTSWKKQLIDLNVTFPVAPGLTFEHMGYPDNWTDLDLWQV